MKDPDGEALYAEIRKLYDGNRDILSVSPAWLATQAMAAINFPRTLHDLGYKGCHLQFRSIAREFCRATFDHTQAKPEADLFPDTLQERYPVRPQANAEPIYVRLDALIDEDIAFNVDRMRRGAGALLRHADALEAYGRQRRSAAA